ncbi:SDR family NAD(P)-dependent oxidoreductase [Athalassotoga saccharophila]|uniref:SDR family NAD(P)-dependent oxidoreductase n=1 Tax=Athalassotoga saccharophila TaxID=1441386 RepID=UPI00137999BB|nr:SDR family oxidoreductase [Athalassotoga saccharophila]BBJ28391.1 3-oxoacyl-[acyl-carrier-protein] reductase FabG [Athalassotoga saccharophila]
MKFRDKVTLITGAASGIGLETAKKFLSEGSVVAACDVNEKGLEEAQKALGIKYRTYKMDVTDFSEVERVVDAIAKDLGRIDVLINNAGSVREKPLLENNLEDFDFTLNVNLKGTYNTTKAVMKYMVKQNGGVVVNVSSIVGVYGNPGQSAYSASKAGVNVLAKVWAKEFARYGIRVNAIAPGYVRTPLISGLSKEKIDEIKSKTLLGRLAEPVEIANVILFLASNESSYITGQVIGVDGGMII